MIYAVIVLIVAVFATLLILSKPKIREEYAVRISDLTTFETSYSTFVKSLPLPKKEPAKLGDVYYKASIRSSLRQISVKRYGRLFDEILNFKPQIQQLLSKSFESLSTLPMIDGIPRIVRIVDFCVKSSKNPFDEERISTVFNVQNEFRTLSYAEILAAKDAFCYVYLKRIAVVLQNVAVLAKMKRIADKYKKDSNSVTLEKSYKLLKESKLFLSFCADNVNFDSSACIEARNIFFEDVTNELTEIFSAYEQIKRVDFEKFYAPMQIFARYETFCNATSVEKSNFLSLVQELSDRENIDEYLFSIRVDNYLKSANFGHIKVVRSSVFGRKMSSIICQKDITSLGAGLSSNILMGLIFGGNSGKNNNPSTLKNGKIENSFEILVKFSNINFGISTKNDRLKISPCLPSFVKRADLSLLHKGTEHKVHIKRGDESALYLGNTKLIGTTNIVLSDKPLDVTCIIEDK